MTAAPLNPLQELARIGQSVWLDDIGRAMLADGSLERLIREDGVAGVTSNPAILAAAMMKDREYAAAIHDLIGKVGSASALYEALAIGDLQSAADLFQERYEHTAGRDGRVSLEVSPHLANDAAGTQSEAQRLWARLARRNAFIKIPGTLAGLWAIRAAIAAGISVNVTLLFSPERYREVAAAYLAGLEDRLSRGAPLTEVASVASFFVSRIDTLVDQRLDGLASAGQPAARALRGQAAIASAARAYEIYREIVGSQRWQTLAAHGARPQRLLWASTSTKDASYSPVKYVEELIAPDTVNTMPLATLEAYRRMGRPELRLERQLTEAHDTRERLGRLGVDLEEVSEQLEREGIEKFIQPFDRLQAWLEERRR